jgi:hypothetical protein
MMEMYPVIDRTELFRLLQGCMTFRVQHEMEDESTLPDWSRGWRELRIEPVPECILILSLGLRDTSLRGINGAGEVEINELMRDAAKLEAVSFRWLFSCFQLVIRSTESQNNVD